MRRREFLTVVGTAMAWPCLAQAQRAATPTIGFLNPASADAFPDRLRAFRRGLSDAGYSEGENVNVVYRWADNQPDRLPGLANELAQRQVNVIIATGGSGPALAAKAATTTIPIVFAVAADPVGLGLVTSLSRPEGNLTGINYFSNELTAKRLSLLCELVPRAVRFAVFVDPTNASNAETILKDIKPIADEKNLQLRVFRVATSRGIDAAFASFG